MSRIWGRPPANVERADDVSEEPASSLHIATSLDRDLALGRNRHTGNPDRGPRPSDAKRRYGPEVLPNTPRSTCLGRNVLRPSEPLDTVAESSSPHATRTCVSCACARPDTNTPPPTHTPAPEAVAAPRTRLEAEEENRCGH